jgi:hypothetical protein
LSQFYSFYFLSVLSDSGAWNIYYLWFLCHLIYLSCINVYAISKYTQVSNSKDLENATAVHTPSSQNSPNSVFKKSLLAALESNFSLRSVLLINLCFSFSFHKKVPDHVHHPTNPLYSQDWETGFIEHEARCSHQILTLLIAMSNFLQSFANCTKHISKFCPFW